MLVNSSIDRGCGKRKAGGLYACVSQSPGGMPLEHFIVDPPVRWMSGPFRGVQLHTRADGIVDMIMWVGEEHYPFPSDFAEEGRTHGFSKRIPLGSESDYSNLTPYQSRLILVHPKAVVSGAYVLREGNHVAGVSPTIDRPQPDTIGKCTHPPRRALSDPPCTFATWDLSALRSHNRVHEVEIAEGEETAHIKTPSVDYFVHLPDKGTVLDTHETTALLPGIFLALPWSHFEYVSEEATLPQLVADKLGNNLAVTAVTPT